MPRSRLGPTARLATALAVVAVTLAAPASPAAAHGVGGRTDLPLPLWLFTWGAAGALVVSFVALRTLWPRPRLRAAADGRSLLDVSPASSIITITLRTIGLALFVTVIVAAWIGDDDPGDNLAPITVYVIVWVGVQALSALVGDVWRLLDPIDTLAAIGQRLRGGGDDAAVSDEDGPAGYGHWTAAAFIGSFVWLELAYHASGSPRSMAVWLTLYVVAALAGAARWGRAWLRYGEGFAALFSMLAAMAPFHRDGEGRLRLRSPLAGLATMPVLPGTNALVLVVLGSTTFDGVSRTDFWLDVLGNSTGWTATMYNTVGVVWVIGLMALAYVWATRMVGRITEQDPDEMAAAFLPSLVPILFAYTLAHYFSLLIFEGQAFTALLSDPLGRGWDLFGTAEDRIDFTVMSPDAVAYVQAGSIVVGHVAGVVAAHDRAVELFPPNLAERSQYPMLGVMVLFTVGGLALLLGG